MSRSPLVTAVTVALTPDFDPTTTSPTSRSSSFKFITPTALVPDFSIIDIKKAKNLNNIEGVIVGKAIYDGDIKLDELAKEIDA